ncbi:hypothetical protein ACVIVD_006708 [Bradyrhizobium liaoningense]
MSDQTRSTVGQRQIGRAGQKRANLDLDRPGKQVPRAGTNDIGQWIINRGRLTESKNIGSLGHGVSLSSRGSGRLVTRLDTPPSSHRHHPDSAIARSYLEKLLQVPFRIPALGETETGIYVTLLLLGRALGEESPEFVKLLALGRAALGKPWEGKGIDHDAIKAAVGERFDEIVDALNLADRVSPVLAAGTKGNPRQIKRFLNALALRLAVAQERGFGNAIEQPHLAKVMLAEMFRAGPGCLDSAPLDLSGFLPGYAERGALRFCRCVGRA